MLLSRSKQIKARLINLVLNFVLLLELFNNGFMQSHSLTLDVEPMRVDVLNHPKTRLQILSLRPDGLGVERLQHLGQVFVLGLEVDLKLGGAGRVRGLLGGWCLARSGGVTSCLRAIGLR